MGNSKKKSSTGQVKQRRTAASKVGSTTSLSERRIATPRPDLLVVKIGDEGKRVRASSKEKTSDVLARLGKAMSKPGMDRAVVFKNDSDTTVYAYSIDPKDTSRLVREDVMGRQTIGKFVSGRFRALTAER